MSRRADRSLNRLTLWVFGSVLLITGIGGFVIPAEYALMSGAPAYNLFHLAFGGLALGLTVWGGEREAVAFNVGFGVIDLYQLAASLLGWWPVAVIQWTWADDLAHGLIGVALIAIGLSRR